MIIPCLSAILFPSCWCNNGPAIASSGVFLSWKWTGPDGVLWLAWLPKTASSGLQTINCGHSFHTECLRDTCSDLGQSASNADRARLCPICHPLLEDRIRELSTTMNRLVKKKRFWKTSKLSTNCQKARFLLSEATNSFSVLSFLVFGGRWAQQWRR